MPRYSRSTLGILTAASAMTCTIALVAGVAAAASCITEDEDADCCRALLVVLAIIDERMNNKRNSKKRRLDVSDFLSIPTKKKRNRIFYDRDAVRQHISHYFLGADAQLTDAMFTRVFRVSRSVFEKIFCVLERQDKFFQDGLDCTKRRKIAPEAKALASLKKLAFGVSSSCLFTEFGMGMSTIDKACLSFCKIIAGSELRKKYLRPMSKHDARRVTMRHKEIHQVDGQLGSLSILPYQYCEGLSRANW